MAWGSWKQDCNVGNTTKVEYIVTHATINEIIWMHKLLGDFGYGQIALIKLWNDNQITIRLLRKNTLYCGRTHIFLEYFPLISNFICSRLTQIKNIFACSKHSNLKNGQSLFFSTSSFIFTKCAPFLLKIGKDFNVDD